jgi:hypothetical protein
MRADPDGLDQEIARVRREKEAAIEWQDFAAACADHGMRPSPTGAASPVPVMSPGSRKHIFRPVEV